MEFYKIYKESFKILFKYLLPLFLFSLPYYLLSSLFFLDKTFGLLCILVLSGPLQVGYYNIVKLLITRNSFTTNDFLIGFTLFKSSLGIYLLNLVFILLGVLLFVIPGIFVYLWLLFSPLLLLEHPALEPLQIFKMSKQLIKGFELHVFLIVGVLIAAMLVAALFQLLFLNIFLLPLQYILITKLYLKIKPLN